MAYLSDFLPSVMQHASACPDPTAEKAVRAAAIELCERTRCWRLLDDHALPAGWSSAIPVSTPTGSRLHEVERAWFDSRELDRATYTDFPQRDDIIGTPSHFTQAQRGEVLVWGQGEAGTLRLSLFLKPSNAADEVPDFLLEDHLDDIAAGALGRILLVPEQTWSNPNLGSFFQMKFDAACNKNFASNIRGQQRASARTRARFL